MRDVSDRLLIELGIAVRGGVKVRKKDPGIYVRLLSARMLKPVNVEAEGTPIELRSIGQIIKNHILSRPFDAGEIAMVEKALNERVSRVRSEVPQNGGVTQYLAVETRGTRLVAEILVQYLECFAREPRLAEHNPIAVCPSCDALFAKKKSNQKYCSQPCNFAGWSAEKSRDAPNYFADKARRYRNIRKKRAVKKAKRV